MQIADVGEIKRLAEERAKEAGLGAGEAEGETSMGFASTSDRKVMFSDLS